MPGLGKNSVQINVTAPKRFADVIDGRRAGLRWTRSQFGLAIFEWWEAQGCPALSAADQAMILAAAIPKGSKTLYPLPRETFNPIVNERP